MSRQGEYLSNGKRAYYDNPNGYLEIEDILRMMLDDTWSEYMRSFKITTHKCNIRGMKPNGIQCFYCGECFQNTIEGIREYKDYYKFRGIKYLKSELLNQEMPGLEELNVEKA